MLGSDGFYPVFSETQTIEGVGYIRSGGQSLKIGEIPQDHKVALKVNIEQLVAPEQGRQSSISFSVSPDLLDFGVLQPGQTASSDLNIVNGATAIYLEAETSGGSVFRNNLLVDSQEVADFSFEMASNANKTLPVQLRVPENYSGDFGQIIGELTFWAIKK